MNKNLYKFSQFTISVFAKLFFSLKIKGRENIPDSGGVILVCNHTSYWDPPIAGTSSIRPVWFMAKAELFKIPLFKNILTGVGAFPVSRKKTDLKALKKALSLLASGEIVGIFPEGTRNKTGKTKTGEIGAAFLALKAKVPVVPMAITQKKLLKTAKSCLPVITKLKVNIGKPIYFSEGEKSEEILRKIMQAIEELKAVD